MKYPKVLRMLTLTAAITLAVPHAAVPAHATENRETPKEYEERTDYQLPEGYHYVLLDDAYVILEEDGSPRIEMDEPVPAEPEVQEIIEVPQEPEAAELSGEAEGGVEGVTEDAGNTGDLGESQDGSEIVGDDGDDGTGSGDAGDTGDAGNSGDADNSGDAGDDNEIPGDDVGKDDTGDGDKTDDGKEDEDKEEDESGKLTAGEAEGKPEETDAPDYSALLEPVQVPQQDVSFLTSAQFLAVRDRIQYNVEVPIEGLPSFITQEMIVGALKAQDETGYPASVTIAQIIQESGFGKYGPGGEEGKGLSYLAYQYCNLFGIKGKGTAGSAVMNTLEMTASGETYQTKAGFRAYHTYTECIEDRSKLLEEVYSDLTENVTDANTFAMKIGRRWATDINYGKSLIRVMQRYDLYRLDDMTLVDFSKLIGRFANPCPGSVISSTFGYRTFDHSFHKGLDLGTGTENIPTYAAEAGIVTFAGEAGNAGNLIIIDHGDGLVTKYMHHEEIYVEKDQKVEKGQQIGLSGTTGDSTGNHLHFQVEENGTAVDPIKYLQEENTETVKMRKKVLVDTNKIVKSVKTRMALHKMEAQLEEQ